MSNWIRVEQRLPSTTEIVLVTYRGRHVGGRGAPRMVIFARYSGGEWRFLEQRDKDRKPERVIAWMPKPEPADTQRTEPTQ